MKQFRLSRIVARAISLAALVMCLGLPAGPVGRGSAVPAHAAPASAAPPVPWQYRGFTIPIWADNGLLDSRPAMQQLARTGANSVTLTVTWYQSNRFATEVRRAGGTAGDDALVRAIQAAHDAGLSVTLKPHVDSLDGNWRADIAPTNLDVWFASYAAMLDHYADLATANGVAVLCIGAELITLSNDLTNDHRWRALIADIRRRFAGKLTYSANWGGGDVREEWSKIPFWDALDYLGISAYFELADNTTPTVQDIKNHWAQWRTSKLEPFQARWGKPLLFMEVGYRSADGTAMHPWDFWDPWPLDTQEQVDCYEALFSYWSDVPWFAGGAFWAWEIDTAIGSNDTGYAVQNKPAVNVITRWFGGRALPAEIERATPSPSTPVPTETPLVSPAPTQAIAAVRASVR